VNAASILRRLFGPRDGEGIPGGCEYCDAYQTVESVSEGIWRMTVHHDEWCPWLRQRERRRKGAA
jgi:hypothetical protein